jgi:UDP-3-O-[3-hydroxymyristoyl] N-acetylglucosamine deacetylase
MSRLNEFQVLQHTLAGPAVCAGVGVHSGRRARLAIRPAAPNTGVVFIRSDLAEADTRIRVAPHAVTRTQLNTEVANAHGVSVSTIEHLMAAFAALGVDNVVVEIDGPETPIMDGSALPFIQLLDRAGRKAQDAARSYIEVLETVEVEDGVKYAAIHPSDRFEIDVEIDFASAAIGRQRVAMAVTERSFRDELASARTFGFVHEVEALRRAGLARGGSLDNAIVLDGDAILNPEGLRMRDEFVRHKALDAIGDLYVLGAPLLGRFESRYGGHALNSKLVKALFDRKSAWRMRAPGVELARAV